MKLKLLFFCKCLLARSLGFSFFSFCFLVGSLFFFFFLAEIESFVGEKGREPAFSSSFSFYFFFPLSRPLSFLALSLFGHSQLSPL